MSNLFMNINCIFKRIIAQGNIFKKILDLNINKGVKAQNKKGGKNMKKHIRACRSNVKQPVCLPEGNFR